MLGHSRAWVLGVALLLGLGMAGTALAQQPTAPPSPPAGRQGLLTPEDRAAMAQIWWLRVQERLALTDQQVTDIRNLLQTQRTAAQPDIQNLIAARKQLRALLEKQPPDPDAVQSTVTQLKTLQAKLFEARLQTRIALRAKFNTSEQWQGWLALRKGMGRHGMWRGRAFGAGAL